MENLTFTKIITNPPTEMEVCPTVRVVNLSGEAELEGELTLLGKDPDWAVANRYFPKSRAYHNRELNDNQEIIVIHHGSGTQTHYLGLRPYILRLAIYLRGLSHWLVVANQQTLLSEKHLNNVTELMAYTSRYQEYYYAEHKYREVLLEQLKEISIPLDYKVHPGAALALAIPIVVPDPPSA
jgi:hypothetical protein